MILFEDGSGMHTSPTLYDNVNVMFCVGMNKRSALPGSRVISFLAKSILWRRTIRA